MWDVLLCYRCRHLDISTLMCLYKARKVNPELEEGCEDFYAYREFEI
jgi:hypothetical protein